MTKPIRLQLSRQKGFNLQGLSLATNGLPAVNVARPSKFGNPYKLGGLLSAIECVEAFRDMWNLALARPTAREALAELRGKNLACWCGPDQPCHADVLLDLTGRMICTEVSDG